MKTVNIILSSTLSTVYLIIISTATKPIPLCPWGTNTTQKLLFAFVCIGTKALVGTVQKLLYCVVLVEGDN